jgi:hypothetical protein
LIDLNSTEKESREVEKIHFNLLLSLTVLSGTIFSSSKALSQNRTFNTPFFIGEFFLFNSTLIGFLILWSQLRAQEWSYFFNTKSRLELVKDDKEEDFIKKAREDLIAEYKKLMDKKGFSWHILKWIPIDHLPTLFFLSFCVGLLLLWLSIFF